MKYSYRGSIILIPAHERMRTPKGIQLLARDISRYDMDYMVEELNKDIWGN